MRSSYNLDKSAGVLRERDGVPAILRLVSLVETYLVLFFFVENP